MAETKEQETSLLIPKINKEVLLPCAPEAKSTSVWSDARKRWFHAPRANVGLCCQINYFRLPDPRNSANELTILQHVFLKAEPNTLTAIMGSTGTGKTTLLDCLLERMAPGSTLDGSIVWYRQTTSTPPAVDAEEDVPVQFAHVPPNGCFYPRLTVRETLSFAAKLHLQGSQWSDKEREAWVEQLLNLLELVKCKNTPVGFDSPSTDGASWQISHSGISSGQRKRLAIGIALMTMPSVLLLDEPTSGLDATTALGVIRLLKNVAKQGCTVLITIHQPSTAIYHHFDHVQLLSGSPVAGSRTMWMGSPHDLRSFLDTHGFAFPDGMNPAEHVLDLSTTANVSATLTEAFRQTQRWCEPGSHEHHVKCRPVTQTHCMRQFAVLFQRNLINQWRDPGVFWVRFVMYFGLCLVVGSVYWTLESDLDVNVHTRFGLHAFMSSFLLALTIAAMPTLLQERSIYVQETNSGHYKALPYVLVLSVANIPYLLVLTLFCTAIQYALIDLYLDTDNLLIYASALFSALYCAEAMMVFLSAMIRGGLMNGLVIGGGATAIGVLLSGFFIPLDQMPPVWQRINTLVLQRYHFQLVIYNDFHGRQFRVSDCIPGNANASSPLVPGPVQPDCFISGDLFLHLFGVTNLDLQWAFVVIWMMSVTWRLLLFLVLSMRCKRGCAIF